MPYIEKDTHNGVLGFDIKDNIAVLSACRGRDTELVIPSEIEYMGENVTVEGISKKTFLSNRYLHSISVPGTVRWIGDWAFAGCRNLEKIVIHPDVRLENGVFKDCVNLKEVYMDTMKSADIGFMLAAVIFLLEDKYLFDLKQAGTAEWIGNWDKRMQVVINEADDEGFSALLACGEEDYEGRDNTLDAYLNRRRKRKVRICLLRLLHDTELEDALRDKLVGYLYNYRPGKPDDETWQVILEEHGDEEEYYELLCKYNVIDKDNVDVCLRDMGQLHARMKAFLLRRCSDSTEENFFGNMDL